MTRFAQTLSNTVFPPVKIGKVALLASASLVFAAAIGPAANAADADGPLVFKAPATPAATLYEWTGFYVGGHLGYAWGNSGWTTAGAAGSFSVAHNVDTFDESGSFFTGVQAGYNHMLPNRLVVGVEVDGTFPSFPSLSGNQIGGGSTFVSPTFGQESFSEQMLASGTVRGRIGYAPGNWLFYATGGFAWSYNQQTLTQISTGNTDSPFLWRLGWAAGAGFEAPVAPHWTARFEYLFVDYGKSSVSYPSIGGQTFNSSFALSELRAGLNYQFANDPAMAAAFAKFEPPADWLNFHGQTTFVYQGYPSFRSPYSGTNSLPGQSETRETLDATLAVGIRMWQGAEIWVNPEIDQGHGLADTHGVAGFPSGESYKLGDTYPYARVNRYFIRQTIDLGGEEQKVDADISQFESKTTANRVVLTVGKFAIVDIFDTNKYANNPKIDFLNWAGINAGTFDYAGDAWGYTYGAAAEWYQGPWTLRAGVFDMSAVPAEAANSGPAYGLDPTFDQFQMVGEIERRYELWGQPGAIKVTGFLTRGRMATFTEAVAFSQATGINIDDATDAVRKYQSRPGVSVNLAQQLTEDIGFFARAGWADGNVEPWDFTDIDRTVQAGLSINGKKWGRPDDTFGVMGIVNGINSAHQAWFNAGGTGILIGDGQLPNPGPEEIFETYYSYALTASTKISVDYQFINNPGYATERGPVNVFAGRFHWQF